MALTVIQAGGTLQLVATDGTLTPLTIPSDIELRQDVSPRWAVYGRYVLLVNTPSRPVTIDSTGTVRPLTPLPPRLAAVLHGGGGEVTLAATGLPTGVGASFSPNPSTGNDNSTLTFTASATADLGLATVTVTGTASGLPDQTTTIDLTVASAVGFTLAAEQNIRVLQGSAAGVTLTITRVGGFADPVTLVSATGQPTGVTATFPTNPVTGGVGSVLFTASGTATLGLSTVTVTATGSGVPTQTATLDLTVAPAVGFTLSSLINTVLPLADVTVLQGATAQTTVVITRHGAFFGLVSLAVTGLPTGVTVTFSENPAGAGGSGSSTLTFTATTTATPGPATVTITGTSTGVPDWPTTLTLIVSTASPGTGFTLSVPNNPTGLTVLQGSTAVTIIGITRTGSFAGAGTLSGTYRVLYTHVIRDSVGNVISESDYSPSGNPATITDQMLAVSNIDVSPDPVDARRLYRTTTNGAVYFQWIDLDGNVLTTVQDDLADAGLGETAGPILGTPPRLTLIAEFRDRLFGVGDLDVDSVVYTETGFMYAWNPLNVIAVPRVGSDTFGVTGLVSRREALGVGRLNRLSQIVGTGEESTTGQTDLRLIKLSDEVGFLGQESIAVYRDTVYFLWFDGVYEWSDNGLVCLSDGNSQGQARVRSWFATDDYFERKSFPIAFAQIDPNRNVYRLFLNDPAGVRHYVEFDLINRVWFGPHRIDAFTASCVFTRLSRTNVKVPTLGATDGGIYAVDGRAADVALTGQPFGIDFDVDTRPFAGTSPDRLQYFGELSVLGRSQPAGTLTITPRLGYLDADGGVALTPQPPIAHSLRKGRERLRRLGSGALAQLNLTHSGVDEEVSILGIEISDVHEVGRR